MIQFMFLPPKNNNLLPLPLISWKKVKSLNLIFIKLCVVYRSVSLSEYSKSVKKGSFSSSNNSSSSSYQPPSRNSKLIKKLNQ